MAAVTAAVLAVVGAVLIFIGPLFQVLGVLLAVAALIVGIAAVVNTRRTGQSGGWLAWAAVVVAVVIGITVLVWQLV
jgi:hypothetical protein